MAGSFGTFFLVFDHDHLNDLAVFDRKKIIQISGVGRLGFIVIAIRERGDDKIAMMINDGIDLEGDLIADHFFIAPAFYGFDTPKIPGKIVNHGVFGEAGYKCVAVMRIGGLNERLDHWRKRCRR